ncbi:flavin monoamine oxidase family protein [Burkholderia stagnalis]|uniref:flavin monoamine oxidase family protein n=1 Tax=Burkholderia stagnalis TaxID=1503054 RepID=UPI000F80A8F8|nr:FAD-dependent oxidoreductase [Burkholderia stagnalis]
MTDTNRISQAAALRRETFRKAMFEHWGAHLFKQRAGIPVRARASTRLTGQRNVGDIKVGIVGGGMAGLYAGLLLQALGIQFEIFEAAPTPGGRVRTHYFNDGSHQYAEMGAMRFPQNFMQSRLFNFWDYLNETSRQHPGARLIPRIPYVMHDATPSPSAGNLLCYNGMRPVTRNRAAADNATLGFDQALSGPEYEPFREGGKLKPAATLLDAALDVFIKKFEDDGIDSAWAYMMTYDSYSARSYLEEIGDGTTPYPSRLIDYLETVLSYSGMFDLALTEMVLDQFSFSSTEHWFAMEGGTSRITDEMANRLPPTAIRTGTRVTRLEETDAGAVIHYDHGSGTRPNTARFDRVFVTLANSALRFIDTPSTWAAGKYEAIRMLKMTNATKIALGFKTRFWERPGPYSEGMKGGQSDTDLPVRSIVYPSFGIGEAGPAYLLGSYCWQNDADKFSHLSDTEMLDVALRSVVHLHGDIAREQYLGHGAAIVWNRDPSVGGAFEFFQAAQFGEIFQNAQAPDGLFNFAGEHLDMVHYWIAGAFNSAYRVVWETLILEGLDSEANLDTLFEALGGGDLNPTMIPHVEGAIQLFNQLFEAAAAA